MKYIKLFEKYTLSEKLTDINMDVDWIYEKYFKKLYDYIKENDKINPLFIRKRTFLSSELISPLCKKAHELNPVIIHINDKQCQSNFYNPFDKKISLKVNDNAVQFALNYNTLTDALKVLHEKQKLSFSQEFKEATIKASIHHELTHWIDDTINNQHIKNKLNKQKETGIRINNINFTEFEIQSQIHNIVQLKRNFDETWNSLTFEDMIKLSPALNKVLNEPDSDAKNEWIFKLKKRMAREGLLGKKMY